MGPPELFDRSKIPQEFWLDSEDLKGKDAVDAFERYRKVGGPFSTVGRLPKTGAFEDRRRTPPLLSPRVATGKRNGCDDSRRTVMVTEPPSRKSRPDGNREPSTDSSTPTSENMPPLTDTDLEAQMPPQALRSTQQALSSTAHATQLE